MDLDLAQVRAFVAVLDHGHFGRAAQTLALSQQALSKRVARLEAQLGPLLERRRGGVALTVAGQCFLPAARQLLEVADHAVAEVRNAPSSGSTRTRTPAGSRSKVCPSGCTTTAGTSMASSTCSA